MFLFLLLVIIVLYLTTIDKKAYDKSQYKKESGIPYLQAKFKPGFHCEYLAFKSALPKQDIGIIKNDF